MKNSILFLLKNKLSLSIKGHNIERFIKRLKNNNIEIINIKYIALDEIVIKIYKKDYEKVLKLKTIYEINILEFDGLIKYKKILLENRFIITFTLIGLIIIYIVTNMIFEVDVITNDSKMKKTILEELDSLGIKKYKFKKDYDKLQNIKLFLLNNHRDEIEWIEIESIGTKYIIKYEPRIKNEIKEDIKYRSIIASKDAIIKKLNISSGQIIKDINTYVKKGDIIVSGYIDLNGDIKDTVGSKGIVYGETWYKVMVTYPYEYNEIKETGKTNKVLVLKLLNKEIELFNFNKFKTKKVLESTIIKNNLLPIKLVKQNQKETNIIREHNTEEEVIEKAVSIAKEKINTMLDEGEFIENYKVLNMIKHSDSITLNIFFTIIEDIGIYKEIEEFKENIEE